MIEIINTLDIKDNKIILEHATDGEFILFDYKLTVNGEEKYVSEIDMLGVSIAMSIAHATNDLNGFIEAVNDCWGTTNNKKIIEALIL